MYVLEVIFLLNVFLIEHKKDRNAKVENIFKYDKREAKKVSPLMTILIEHLTGNVRYRLVTIVSRSMCNLLQKTETICN